MAAYPLTVPFEVGVGVGEGDGVGLGAGGCNFAVVAYFVPSQLEQHSLGCPY